MKIIVNDHFLCKGMTFEVAKRLSDHVITTDGNMFFLDQFTSSQYTGTEVASRKLEAIEQARTIQTPESWKGVMRSLSRLQAKVILIVSDYQPIAVNKIAQRAFVSQQSVATILDQLKALELVVSQKGKDKRESYYSLIDVQLSAMLQDRLKCGSRFRPSRVQPEAVVRRV